MNKLVDFLTQRLQDNLPGVEAQILMMPTLSDKGRFSPEAKKDAKEGGVMLMLYRKSGRWYFPLIQRPDYDGVHAKQMSFPGGKVDDKDADLIETALRETEEEVGISAIQIQTIGQLSQLYIIASNFSVLPVIGYFDGEPEFVPDEFEVDSIEEIALEDLMDDNLQKVKPLTILQGVTIQAPYFDLNGKTVWGATAMMLSEFKQILRPFFEGQQTGL